MTDSVAQPPRAISESASAWRALAADPVVRLQAGLLILVGAIYVTPGLTLDQRWDWTFLSELPLALVCVLAFQSGLRRLPDAAERHFWNLWSWALAAWMLKSLVPLVISDPEEPGLAVELIVNVAFYVFYALAAMALESRPHSPRQGAAGAVRAVERIGTLVFLTGLLAYLAVIPALLDPASYVQSSMLMYVTLDAYLLIQLAAFLRGSSDSTWRRIYRWLLVTVALWFATDLFELLEWMELAPDLAAVSWVDLAWLPPWMTLVLAARVRHVPAPAVLPSARSWEFRLGPLVTVAVSFPVLHFGVVRAGLTGADSEPVQEASALLLLLVLATLVMIRQELLQKETRRLEEERREARREIEHLAFHDALTGVPNRRLLDDRVALALGRSRRFKRKLAVMLLDIDHFKAVNDSLGHDVGDEVLRQMAERLQRCVRGGDTVARLGGDEFVVMLEGLRDSEDYRRVFELMTATLEAPFEVGDHSLIIQVAIGTGLFPDHGGSLEELLKQADRAMYRAKRSGEAS